MAEKTVPATSETTVPQKRETTRSEQTYMTPPVDIFEEDDRLVVVADLPGIDKESISVNVKDGILTIQGTGQPERSGTPIYSEFEYVNYYRQFELSEKIDVEKINADYKHGVLTLNLPKEEKAKSRKIAVKF